MPARAIDGDEVREALVIVKAAVLDMRNYILEWFQADEIDEVVQACLIHWTKRRGTYRDDGGASRTTYIWEITKRKVIDLVRERSAKKRGSGYQIESLDTTVEDEDGNNIARVATLQNYHSYWQPVGANDLIVSEELQELRRLLKVACKKLKPLQKQMVALFKKGVTKAAAARKLHVARTTLNDEVKRIRAIFKENGIGPNGALATAHKPSATTELPKAA